jgi:hypothetical protein
MFWHIASAGIDRRHVSNLCTSTVKSLTQALNGLSPATIGPNISARRYRLGLAVQVSAEWCIVG